MKMAFTPQPSLVTKGGRWYQGRSLPELDQLFAQQKFITDPEARTQVIWEMDKLAMNDAAFLILHWVDLHHVQWNVIAQPPAWYNPLDKKGCGV